MEKTFQLEPREMQKTQQFDQERTQALAMVGALSLDMEQAKKNLDAAAERQRAFIRQALETRGVEQYENARIQNGTLLVSVPDGPVPLPAIAKPAVPERVNGAAADAGVKE